MFSSLLVSANGGNFDSEYECGYEKTVLILVGCKQTLNIYLSVKITSIIINNL